MAASARGWQMIEIVTVLVALCLISVVMRVVARLQRRVGLGVDDYLSIVSMVLMIAMLIELCLCECAHDSCWMSLLTVPGCTIGGNGAHVKTLDAETMMNYWKVYIPSPMALHEF